MITRLVVATLLALGLLPAYGASPSGSEVVTVLSSNAVSASLAELGPRFERASGHRLEIHFDSTAPLLQVIAHGTPFDVAILTHEAAQELSRNGTVTLAKDIARSGIGIAVPGGAPVPDVSSVSALEHALLNAGSVAFNPKGGSGIYFEQLLQRLGIADQINAKAKRATTPAIADMLAHSQVDLVVEQISEIYAFQGAQFAGPLPASVQHETVFTVCVATHAPHLAAARALEKFLSNPAATTVYGGKWLQPP